MLILHTVVLWTLLGLWLWLAVAPRRGRYDQGFIDHWAFRLLSFGMAMLMLKTLISIWSE